MNVNLHIERLVLDAELVPPRQRAKVKAALADELTRLLASEGLPARFEASQSMRSVAASGIELTRGQPPGELGKQIARSVYQGMSR